jgi:hypothetical protein
VYNPPERRCSGLKVRSPPLFYAIVVDYVSPLGVFAPP